MKKVLIDINVLIDMVAARDDFHSATAVFDLCAKRRLKGYVCSHEITTFSYLLERLGLSKLRASDLISGLLDTLSVVPAIESTFREALISPIGDFEDAVIEVSGLKEQVDYIITRNRKDFDAGRITCCSAVEFLAMNTR